MAPTAISIPPADTQMSNGAGHDDQWNQNGARSPGRDAAPRRSSRSRSPRRDNDRGRADDGSNNPGNNLHVSGLSGRVDSRDLEAAFAKIGRVKKASVMYDPHSRESRGFGFVTMESGEEAEAAVTALNGTDLMGRSLNVEKARRARARTPTPGRYYGPPKRNEPGERFYDPRPYDSRYARDDNEDRRGGRGRHDDHRGRDRDHERGGYRDYDRGGYGREPPPRDYREDRGGRYDSDRRY